MASGGDLSLLTMTDLFGPDARPTGLRATEAISQPFLFCVTFASPEQSIDPDRALARPLCVSVATGAGTTRHFHGQVRALHAAGAGRRGEWNYTAELVPAFWFARQTMDCRVFLKKSVADILTTLFTENNVTKNRLSIQGARATRDHTIQFNETDFDFACRLMQEEGYFFWFEHAIDGHTMVVADSNQAFADSLPDSLHVVPDGRNHDVLNQWRRQVETAHGKWRLLDYNPLNPGTAVDGHQPTVLTASGAASRDMMQWPAREYASGDATGRARLRQEAAEAGAAVYHGSGSCADLVPGLKFALHEDPLSGASGAEYVVRSVEHTAVDESDMAGGATWSYGNTLTAFPAATTWREPHETARPVMGGIYLAIVLAPDGEEIHTDEYGRVKIRMMFDHRADATSDTTIWARVMQPWASNAWGWQHIPRVGNEVAVAFVDGDPDRPIVVGSLYNAAMMPVFPLPDEKTKSGLRTRSSLKGGAGDFSELSFDDKKGDELVFLHAQKDHKVEVENDAKWHVMNNHTFTVDNVQKITIGNGRSAEITKANESLTVKQGDIAVEASLGKIDHSALKSYTVASKTDVMGLSAFRDITIDSQTGNVKVTALQSIELSVLGGMSSIKLDAMGITMKGMMIKADGGLMLDMKALMTKVSGDGMVMVKGGILMLN